MSALQIMLNFAHAKANVMTELKQKCRNRIRVILAEKELTNHWLADKMGVTDISVSRWTTNKIQPSMAQFISISTLLGVDINELIEQD